MRGWKSGRELAWRGLVHAVAGGTISGNDWLSWKRAKHLPRPFSSGQTERRDRRRRASRRGASRRWPATRRRRQQDQYRPRESVPPAARLKLSLRKEIHVKIVYLIYYLWSRQIFVLFSICIIFINYIIYLLILYWRHLVINLYN